MRHGNGSDGAPGNGGGPSAEEAAAAAAELAELLAPAGPPPIAFEREGEQWLARPAGTGLTGTGRYGVAPVTAVHFFRADRPDHPVYEALIPRGRLPGLYDEELRELLAKATEIRHPDR